MKLTSKIRAEVLKDLRKENKIIKDIPNVYGSRYNAEPTFSYDPTLKDKLRMEEHTTPSGIKYVFASYSPTCHKDTPTVGFYFVSWRLGTKQL